MRSKASLDFYRKVEHGCRVSFTNCLHLIPVINCQNSLVQLVRKPWLSSAATSIADQAGRVQALLRADAHPFPLRHRGLRALDIRARNDSSPTLSIEALDVACGRAVRLVPSSRSKAAGGGLCVGGSDCPPAVRLVHPAPRLPPRRLLPRPRSHHHHRHIVQVPPSPASRIHQIFAE